MKFCFLFLFLVLAHDVCAAPKRFKETLPEFKKSCTFFATIHPSSLNAIETWPLSELEKSRLQPQLISQYPNAYSDLFKIVNVLPGVHGGHRLVIERQGTWWDWRKNFEAGGGDITQDLRLLPHLLGKSSHFFGFRWLDDRHVLAPDVTELNGAIHAFNAKLPAQDPRRIGLTYYPTQDSFIPLETYVARFAFNGQIPISQNARQFFHDLSSHPIEDFFLDEKLVEIARTRGRFWITFVKAMRKKYAGHTKILAELERAHKDNIGYLGRYIDFMGMGSGDFLPKSSRLFLGKVGVETAFSLPETTLNQISENGALGFSHKAANGGVSRGLNNNGELHLYNKDVTTLFMSNYGEMPFAQDFERFRQDYERAHPRALEPIGYNLAEELDNIAYALEENKDEASREAALLKLKLGAPYIERLHWLRSLARF